jgi:DNA ligase (NAD+)
VATVEPVQLAGTTVQRASLYNFSYIKEIGIDVGAEVMISKRGEIIPAISEVVKSTGTIFPTPTKCPTCSGPVEMQGENLQCISVDTCPSLTIGRLTNWINANNILEWGESLISKLVETKKVNTIVDLYKLSIDDLASLERMGIKSATNCFNSLHSHNPIPLNIFLGALSIPGIGTSTIDIMIENGFDTIDKILAATKEQIASCKGLGSVKASSLWNGLKRNKEIINGLFERGIAVMNKEVKAVVSGGKLNGQSFVITGKTNIVRKTLQEMIEGAGGVFEKSVSKTTNFLVIVDPESATKKAQAARANGTVVISEDDLLAMIG